MTAILSMARKEVAALLRSQVALLFLAMFLLATHITFFISSRFFARNVADLNPLFDWIPLLLVALVSAVAMRAWAEEQQAGTLEILLTLPVRTLDLVLGKYVAGMALIGIALLATTPIALTVAFIGPLDWGPAIGGYLGAFLLGSAYLSIGLCVSARTDNQVVALMGTLALGGALYLVGTDEVRALTDVQTGTWLGNIGTGSRFENIARGVVDLRDLGYYLSLTVFFLTLNGVFIERRRLDSNGNGRKRSNRLWTIAALVAANALLWNVWMHPVRTARLDLTQHQDFTISSVTRDVLADLEEPLTITGVFSGRSHPKLQPLVPRLTALLEEYERVGGGRVQTHIVDPSQDSAVATDLVEAYGIRPVAMQTADRNEVRSINSWFHVVLEIGDAHKVIAFNQLVEIDTQSSDTHVRLRDPEYDLTRTIRRVQQEFATSQSLAAQLPRGTSFRLYASPNTMDPQNLESLDVVRKALDKTVGYGDFIELEELDPTTDPALAASLSEEFGIEPRLSISTGSSYFFHLIIQSGKVVQLIAPKSAVDASTFQRVLDSSMQRLVPGQLKTVAILTEPPVLQGPDRPPRAPDYTLLTSILGQRYETELLQMTDGEIPGHVDLLLVAKPGRMSTELQTAMDQYLLRGGTILTFVASNQVLRERGRFEAKPMFVPWLQQLEAYGVRVEEGHVLDVRSGKWPRASNAGPPVPYPYWLDVRRDQMAVDLPVMRNLPSVSMPWSSALSIVETEPATESTVLLSTSRAGWLRESDTLMPDPKLFGPLGFPEPENQRAFSLGVNLTGSFPSAFPDANEPGQLTRAVSEGRLIAIGSADVIADDILRFGKQPSGKLHANNPLFLQNLVDWAVEDTDLLSIRHAGRFDRPLDPLDNQTRNIIEYGNLVMCGGVLLVLALVARRRRPLPTIEEA